MKKKTKKIRKIEILGRLLWEVSQKDKRQHTDLLNAIAKIKKQLNEILKDKTNVDDNSQ